MNKIAKIKINLLFILAISLAFNPISVSAQSQSYQKWTKIQPPKIIIDTEISKEKVVDFVKDKFFDYVIKKLKSDKYITKVHQDISTLTGNVNTFLDNIGIHVKTGKLGLPNVQQAQIVLEDSKVLKELSDIFGTQTGTSNDNKQKLYQQYLYALSKEYSENSALSLEGQSKLGIKVDSAVGSALQSVEIAYDSSDQDISQNILRNVSNQMALSQQTDAMIISDLQDAKVDRSLDLQLTSEMLSEVSGQNIRNQRINNAGNNAVQTSLFMVSIPGKY